jgi:hypothetical protein
MKISPQVTILVRKVFAILVKIHPELKQISRLQYRNITSFLHIQPESIVSLAWSPVIREMWVIDMRLVIRELWEIDLFSKICIIGYARIPVQNDLDRQNSTIVTRNICPGPVLHVSVPLYEVGQTETVGITEHGGVLHIRTSL